MPKGSPELTNARKEEIFLALLQREYALWIADLAAMMAANDALTK